MGSMQIMDRSGHSTITWDPKNEASVETARQAFDTIVKQGMTPFRVGPDGKAEQIERKFDPEAREIVFAPPMIGG